MKITFSKSPDVMDSPSAGKALRGGDAPKPSQVGKRGHTPGTPASPPKTRSKLDDELAEQLEDAEVGEPPEPMDEVPDDVVAGHDLQSDESVKFGVGDVIRAPRIGEQATEEVEETLRLVECIGSNWAAVRLGLASARMRRTTRSGADGWLIEQPLRKPGQWTKWIGVNKYGEQAEEEAARVKAKWDVEDFAAFVVANGGVCDRSDGPLYSLEKARKCDPLETAGLLSMDSVEGPAEWARRLAAATFRNNTQHGSGYGDDDGAGEDGEPEASHAMCSQ